MVSIWPALVLTGILPFGGDGEARPFPVEARGNIRFELDAARFSSTADFPMEIYLSIPQSTLAVSPDSAGRAKLRLETRFEDADSDLLGRVVEERWVPLESLGEEDATLLPRLLVTLRPKAPEGTRQIAVRVIDLAGRKRGLFDRARRSKPSGEARGRFVGDPLRCRFSDIVFVWDIDRDLEADDLPLRHRLRPNPLRYYGLYHTTLLFYVEDYGGPEPLVYQIRSLSGEAVVASGIDSCRDASGGGIRHLRGEDISALPAGAYRLDILGSKGENCGTAGEFQILWDSESWNKDQRALLEEAYVLLGAGEYDRVQEMSQGEIEEYMRNLWSRHDPDRSTGRNELRDVYLERLEYANRFFGTSFRKGMLTDRGRVYIRYGPPDEITKQLNPQDEEAIARVLPDELSSEREDVMRRPARRRARDDRAYEIWKYQVRGQPLFPDLESPVQRTGLEFIFVDELGYGDMRLVHTNLAGPF